jgi:NDP-sugar pyrophosphorylase family protein
LLPVHAVVMAGGEGRRLRPHTEKVPKPLLDVGGKPIIQYNLEHLARYGIESMTISIRYLGQQLKDTFSDGQQFGWQVDYVEEDQPMGTLGALRMLSNFSSKHLLVMNSDLLTNIDFEDFFQEYTAHDADMAVATIPYRVKVPYAVLQTEGNRITQFEEKPDYVYYSNAGIYLMRRDLVSLIPENEMYNATDMMERLIADGRKVISYPVRNYWLDIGNPEDFAKAQEDIRHIHFE